MFRANGIACVDTGVNPDFLMEYLPCVLTGAVIPFERLIVVGPETPKHRNPDKVIELIFIYIPEKILKHQSTPE
jgi:hypothetical protein